MQRCSLFERCNISTSWFGERNSSRMCLLAHAACYSGYALCSQCCAGLLFSLCCAGLFSLCCAGLFSLCCAGAFYESASTALIVIDLSGPSEQLQYVKAKIEVWMIESAQSDSNE